MTFGEYIAKDLGRSLLEILGKTSASMDLNMKNLENLETFGEIRDIWNTFYCLIGNFVVYTYIVDCIYFVSIRQNW